MRFIAIAVLIAASALAADAPPAVPAAAAAASPTVDPAPPPFTVDELFRPLQYRHYALSPRGEFMLEYYRTARTVLDSDRPPTPEGQVESLEPAQQILLTDLRVNQFQRLSRGLAGYSIIDPLWLDERHVVWNTTLEAKGRTEYFPERVSITNRPDGSFVVEEIQRLTRFGGFLGLAPIDRSRVLFMDRAVDGMRVYLTQPIDGLEADLTPANQVLDGVNTLDAVALDRNGVVRAFSATRRGTEQRIYSRQDLTAPWRAIHAFPTTGDSSVSLHGFDEAGRNLLVISSEGTDKAVLRELDPETGALGRILFEDPRNDLLAPVIHSRTGRLLGVTVNDSVARMEAIDPKLKLIHARIRKQLPNNEPRIIAVDDDLNRAVIFTAESDNPGRYSLYETATDKILLIARAAPWLKDRKLVRTREVALTARDGLAITGYYTPPAYAKHARQPLVLMPHGGPLWVRERLVFDPEVQLLASHGYAVMQVDFRGSGGYGREFLRKGYKQWGRQMQDDLVDAVRYAIAQGWADPEKVCIYGASYGGYAAMMGLARNPELFQCGVTLAGVSDLNLLFESKEVRELPGLRDLITKVIGDPDKEKQVLEDNSPVKLAKQIKRPVFIAHGGKDSRAVPQHALKLKAALEANGSKVEWMYFESAGHGFSDMAHQRKFYGKLIEFLDRNIGSAQGVPAAPASGGGSAK